MQSMAGAAGAHGRNGGSNGRGRAAGPPRGVRGRPAGLRVPGTTPGGVALPQGTSLPPPDDSGGDEGAEGPPWLYMVRIWAGEYLEEGQGPSSVLGAGDYMVSQAVEVWVAPGILGEAVELKAARLRLGAYLRTMARAVAAAAYGQGIKLDIGAELRVRGQADAGDPDPDMLSEAQALAELVRSWVDAGVQAGARLAGRTPDPDALGPVGYEAQDPDPGDEEAQAGEDG